MKSIILFFGLLWNGVAVAQSTIQPFVIRQRVVSGATSEQQASYAILAYNQIQSQANAHYQAGQSITLHPGFEAQAGSVFEATIGKVSTIGSEPTFWVRAYPNPFSEQTQIEYSLPLGGSVQHRLLDVKGQPIGLLQPLDEQEAGMHQRAIDTAHLPAGIYLYQVQAGNQTSTVRLVKKP